MEYELYIDVFFLVNFMMDFCILLIAKKILKCPVAYKTLGAGACLGAFLTSITMVIPLKSRVVRFLIFHGFINVFMLKAGLRIKGIRKSLKAYITLYCATFLVGGIFSCINQYIRESSMFFAAALMSYWGAKGIWEWICHQGKYNRVHCEVLLCQGTNQVKVKAILDTGNRLRDSVTGKPVSIISKKTASVLWKEIPLDGLRYIPYHTIGRKRGILPVFVLDEMILCLEEEQLIKKPLVAVCDEQDGMGKYEMILNADMR